MRTQPHRYIFTWTTPFKVSTRFLGTILSTCFFRRRIDWSCEWIVISCGPICDIAMQTKETDVDEDISKRVSGNFSALWLAFALLRSSLTVLGLSTDVTYMVRRPAKHPLSFSAPDHAKKSIPSVGSNTPDRYTWRIVSAAPRLRIATCLALSHLCECIWLFYYPLNQ